MIMSLKNKESKEENAYSDGKSPYKDDYLKDQDSSENNIGGLGLSMVFQASHNEDQIRQSIKDQQIIAFNNPRLKYAFRMLLYFA